jgi:Spy/CpxP family protein refolding chaperone
MNGTISRASEDVNGCSPSSTIIHDDEKMLHKQDEFPGEVPAGYQQDPWFDNLNNTAEQSQASRPHGTNTTLSSNKSNRTLEETLRACVCSDPTDQTHVR